MKVLRFILNRNFLLVLAFGLGLLVGDRAEWLSRLTVPALILVMTVSVLQVDHRTMLPLRSVLKPVLLTVLFSYVISAACIIMAARLLLEDKSLIAGFAIVAAAPPGIAIIPFSQILKADERFSMLGTVGAYVISVAITPLILALIIGEVTLSPLRLLTVLAELILIPLALSRVLRLFKAADAIARYKGPIINFGLFLVIFAVIAINRQAIFESPSVLARVFLIAFISIFGLASVLMALLWFSPLQRKTKISLLLPGTVKNTGFAAATSLALLDSQASIPAAVSSAVLVFYLLLLSFFLPKFGKSEK